MMEIMVCILLIYESVSDIRSRRVNVIPMAFVGGMGIAVNSIIYERTVLWLAAGAALGIGLLFISFFTRQRIGYGDGILFITLGLCFGIGKCIWILWLSLILVCIAGIWCMLVKKTGRKLALPFFPFVTVCVLIMLPVWG